MLKIPLKISFIFLAALTSHYAAMAQNWGWADWSSGRSVFNGVEVSDNGINGPNDVIYATGSQDGAFTFQYNSGFSTLAPPSNIPVGVVTPEAFLAQYDRNGSINWVSGITTVNPTGFGQGFDSGRKIAVDRNGNVYVLGVFNSQFADVHDASGITQFTMDKWDASSPDMDLYVICYDATGTPLWGHRLSTSGDDLAGDIEVTASHVYVTGALQGQDFVTASYNAAASVAPTVVNWFAPDYEAFVLKIDVFTGQIVDNVIMGNSGNEYGIRLTAPA